MNFVTVIQKTLFEGKFNFVPMTTWTRRNAQPCQPEAGRVAGSLFSRAGSLFSRTGSWSVTNQILVLTNARGCVCQAPRPPRKTLGRKMESCTRPQNFKIKWTADKNTRSWILMSVLLLRCIFGRDFFVFWLHHFYMNLAFSNPIILHTALIHSPLDSFDTIEDIIPLNRK